MREKIIIPESFLIVVDDVGWWLGADKRYHVNIPDWAEPMWTRPYSIEDYRALIELGRALDMRVLCGFTIGEWDRDAILARVPRSSKYGAAWTNAEALSRVNEFDEVRDLINASCDYIEMAVHGLNHMQWDDETGECLFAEYYHRREGKNYMLPESVMRAHLDAWFEIYARNGFKASIDKLIPPCFFYNFSRGKGEMSHILRDYGIKYVSTPFEVMGYDTDEAPRGACVENGILTTDRTQDISPWCEIDAKCPDVLKSSYYGTHWPHFIAMDPRDNMKTVARWVEYFKQYKNKFDVICARDHEMGARQAFYHRFTKLVPLGGERYALDFTAADAECKIYDLVGEEIYINVKSPYVLTAESGCRAEIYKRANSFTTYKVTRGTEKAIVALK